MMNEILPPPPLLLTGTRVHASYLDQIVPGYCGNPLIEALPHILSADEAMQLLAYDPGYNEIGSTLPAEIRLHLIQDAVHFFQPLSVHVDLEQKISRMIRDGYRARNPVERTFWSDIRMNVELLKSQQKSRRRVRSSAVALTILGMSGMGKSSALEEVFSLYPQVIYHTCYSQRIFSHTQLCWLKLDCPQDGSLRGLCLNFFQAVDSILGTNYFQNYRANQRVTADELIPEMARVAANHSLGVLAIDEIQNLSEAKSGGDRKMLNFFVQLINTIGLPVILIGTYKAQPILTGEFRQIRRGSGQGDIVWDRMQEDDEWQLFLESLWRYQYIEHLTPLTSDLSHTLYYESQGITDFAVKLFMLAQIAAITSGKERLSPGLIHGVAKSNLRLAQPILSALKAGTPGNVLNLRLGDVAPIDLEPHFAHAQSTVQIVNRIHQGTETQPNRPTEEQTPTNKSTLSQHSMETAQATLPALSKDVTDQAPRKRVKASLSGLLETVAQGRQQKLAAYESLQQGGYLRPVYEYLAGELYT